MSVHDDEVIAVRRFLDRLDSNSEADISDILDAQSQDPWQEYSDSTPTTPILSTSPSQAESRAVFLSPLVLPALDDALEMNKPLPKVQTYDSPRIYKPDNEIFPSFKIVCQKWRRPDDRWKAISEQAGKHRQDGTILKVCKRLRSPSALKVGVMPSAAQRVQELHLQMDRKQQASLRSWMDVISELFKNLKHLHLFDYDQTSDSSFTRRDRSSKSEGNLSDDECVVNDVNSENVPSRLISNKRLYVLYRLPKLISIDGKIVTVSERLMARPTKLNERPSQKVSTGTKGTQTIQKFQPVHISLKGNNNLSIGRTDWFMKPPGGPNAISSLLDASENEDDDATTDIVEQCVEVSLSGCVIDHQTKQPLHETADSDLSKFIILPLLDSKNIDSTEGTLSALAKLDRLEYCTSVGGSVACEWSAACGILALPSFRRSRQQQRLKCNTPRSSSSLSTSTDTDKNSNGTPRRHLKFKSPTGSGGTKKSERSVSTSLHGNGIASNLSRSRVLDLSSHNKTSKLWVLKSNGKLMSPKCTGDGEDSKGQLGKNLILADNAKDGRSRRHVAKTENGLLQDNEVRCLTATSLVTTEIEKPQKTSRLTTSISEKTTSRNNKVQSTKADSSPTTPRRSSSIKLLAASKCRIASQSLASPFPMQFRVRARPSPKSLDMKRESSELPKKGTLYVQTQFETDDLKNQSVHKSQSKEADKDLDNVSSTKSTLLDPVMSDVTSTSPRTSQSQDENSKSSTPVLSKKPPQCPSSSHRMLVMKSSTSSLSAKNKSDHSHRHRIQARSSSILDDDFGEDDDDSTCEESITEADYPSLAIE